MRLISLCLYGTVFITGAAVLIVEVAAVRLLAPYFGASMYVLSSVLTVILLSLSLGYYLGGKCADRYPFVVPLYFIITCSGASLLMLTVCAQYALPVAGASLSLAIGPLFLSTLFFLLPAFLLGIDSPYVIKLLSEATPADERGSVVGTTFFWSTAGSITGSLLAGFFLIPSLGLTATLYGTSIVLLTLGIVGMFTLRILWRRHITNDTRNNVQLVPPILVLVVLTAAALWFGLTRPTGGEVIFSTEGRYSHITIYDDEIRGIPARIMKRDINNSSALNLSGPELLFPYSQFISLYPQLVPDAKSFLLLGGGAYTLARAVHEFDDDIMIDVVELEPQLFDLAQQYFDLPISDRITNHVMDARVFVNRSNKQYDVIFLDTYNSGHFIPPHLVTAEYFNNLKQLLTPSGVIITNLIGRAQVRDQASMTGSFLKTYLSHFPNSHFYATAPDHLDYSQNFVLISRQPGQPITVNASSTIASYFKTYAVADMQLEPYQYIGTSDIILTDDHNPAEVLILKDTLTRR